MPENTLSIYSMDITREAVSAFLSPIIAQFNEGFAIVEQYGENLFGKKEIINDLPKRVDDLVAGRIFDGQKQIKFRRIGDELFRFVLDFYVRGCRGTSIGVAGKSCRQIVLWGYRNAGLGNVMYEERIPLLFDYPVPEEIAATLQPRDRLAVQVEIFENAEGRTIYDRFVALGKWEPGPA